jgi:riboflavin synthase
MFTGIVEETGVIAAIKPTATAIQLTVRAQVCARGVKLGDSIAVNGCCLTVTKLRRGKAGSTLQFDLLKETWERTNLSATAPGASVNLERALAVGDRLGGHFVTGHVDGTGVITRWERSGTDHVLEVSAPKELRPYLVFKGSVAVDGISLTVAALADRTFDVQIIPHTWTATTLRHAGPGTTVNLECDMVGKYVLRSLSLGTTRA